MRSLSSSSTSKKRVASEKLYFGSDVDLPLRHEWPTFESTNFLVREYQRWTYSYMNRILSVGAAQGNSKSSEDARLSHNDLYHAPTTMASLNLQNHFEHYHSKDAAIATTATTTTTTTTTTSDNEASDANKEERLKKDQRRLLGTLWKLAAPTMLPAGICQFILVVAQVSNPLIVQQMIELLEYNEDESIWRAGLPFVILMLCATTANAFANHRQRHLSTQSGIVIRAAVINMVYKHSLALTPQGKLGLSTGEVTNLIAIDSQKLFEVMQEIHLLWSCPLQMIVVAALLLIVMGPATLVGIFVLCAFFPIAQQLGALLLSIRKRRIVISDQRVEIVNAMLQGIKVTKLNNYEERYRTRVLQTRQQEIALLHRELFVWGISLMTTMMTPVIASGSTFATYVLISEDNRLYASTTFPVLLLFLALRFPMRYTSRLIGRAAQALQATQRIAKFLSRETRPIRLVENGKNEERASKPQRPMLMVKNATFTVEGKSPASRNSSEDSKEKDENVKEKPSKVKEPQGTDNAIQQTDHEQGSILTHSFTLSGVNFTLNSGEILAVVGPVGSGKSTLMNGLVGDATKTDETVVEFRLSKPRLAFASQIPFILNATLRDNILFGLPYTEERYQQVLDACCLRQDIEELGRGGDLTEIGERGVTLSGGV